MQEHTLVGLAQAENVTHFLTRETLEVAHRHDGALLRRQIVETAVDRGADLPVGEERFGAVERGRPPLELTEAAEAIVARRRLFVFEGDLPSVAHGAGLGAIDGDARDPSLEARAPLERRERVEDGGPGVLRDFFGDARALHVAVGEAHEHRVVRVEELAKSGLVAVAKSLEQVHEC